MLRGWVNRSKLKFYEGEIFLLGNGIFFLWFENIDG